MPLFRIQNKLHVFLEINIFFKWMLLTIIILISNIIQHTPTVLCIKICEATIWLSCMLETDVKSPYFQNFNFQFSNTWEIWRHVRRKEWRKYLTIDLGVLIVVIVNSPCLFSKLRYNTMRGNTTLASFVVDKW